MIDFDLEQEGNESIAKIKVIGVGGGGNNAVKRMIEADLYGVEFYVVNTDLQALRTCHNAVRVQIGAETTGGLGAGANPEKGRQAADEDREKLKAIVEGADMVFVTAGMGGGTGTGAAPVIAALAKESGALTIGVVTRPFQFEGNGRSRNSEIGLEEIRSSTDSVIIIPNDRLKEHADPNIPLRHAFRMVDDVLLDAVKSISDLITTPGEINLDFADIQGIMTNSGSSLMGIGRASGDKRAENASRHAISSPLLEESSILGATGIIVNITGPTDMTMQEMHDATDVVRSESDAENIIFGLTYDESLDDEVSVTVIATGFDHQDEYGRDRHYGDGQYGQDGPMPRGGTLGRVVGRTQQQDPRRRARLDRNDRSAHTQRSPQDARFGTAPTDDFIDTDETQFAETPENLNRTGTTQQRRSQAFDVGEDNDIPTFIRRRDPRRRQ